MAASPFPGMDPYLEHPELWPDVHNRLIAAIGDHLGPLLAPRYVARIEERTYVVEPGELELLYLGRPDVTVRDAGGAPPEAGARSGTAPGAVAVEVVVPVETRETWLEVRSVPRGGLVTVLEVLSPTNKVQGRGRRIYTKKRNRVLATRTSLVEVDLVRAGDPMLVRFAGAARRSDYSILVTQGWRRPNGDLYAFSVRDPMPPFALPLRRGDPGPELDLGAILAGLYDRAAYHLSVDYARDAVPPLAEPDRGWAHERVVGAGRR